MQWIHVHSDFSNSQLGFRDSINTVSALVKYHKEQGKTAVVLTDHGGLSSHIELQRQCKKHNLKPIFGNEIYIAEEGLCAENHIPGSRFNHMVLMAKNRKGWEQLNELATMATERTYTAGVKRVPNYISDLVKVINAGGQNIIATTACLGGLFNPLIQEFHRSRSEETKQQIIDNINFLRDLFGENNFYLEIQPALYEEQLIYNSWLGVFGQATNTKLVVGVDAHYLTKEHFRIHSAFLNSQKDKERETADFYKYTYFMDEIEMRVNLRQSLGLTEEMIDEAVSNTDLIVEMCEEYSISSSVVIPRVDVPAKEEWDKSYLDYTQYPYFAKFIHSKELDNQYFISQVCKGIEKYVNNGVLDKCVAINRISEELDTIWEISIKLQDNLSAYFTTMQKILDIIWKISVVGAGRGSAGGFLLNFVMEITQVNPLDYDLPAFRFLHPSRPELADIDCDLSSTLKHSVLQLLSTEFNNMGKITAQVATFGTEKSKAAIITACSGLDLEPEIGLFIASLIPVDRGFPRGIQESYESVPTFKTAIDEYPEVLEVALGIEGTITSVGQHAAAVVFIEKDQLFSRTSLIKTPKGFWCTAYNLHDLEEVGLVKYDLLNTNAIDSIQTNMMLLCEYGYIQWQGNIKDTYNKYLHPSMIDYDTKEMWDMVNKKEILGLFQYDSPQGVQTIDLLQPQNIWEFAAGNSAMRLMASDEHPELPLVTFARHKTAPTLWISMMDKYNLTQQEREYLKPHLTNTYGVCIEQEQIMKISLEGGLFDMKLANKLRKSIAKKQASTLAEVKKEWYSLGEQKGFSKNYLDYCWYECFMLSAGYGLNEAPLYSNI